jgi:hypothetical protein
MGKEHRRLDWMGPLPDMNMDIPERFNDYRCTDYFASDTYSHGVWDKSSHIWVIVGFGEVVEHSELEFLVIGRPGCDGIEFGYRKRHDGLWAYYPIDREFKLVAPSISALVEGWLARTTKI